MSVLEQDLIRDLIRDPSTPTVIGVSESKSLEGKNEFVFPSAEIYQSQKKRKISSLLVQNSSQLLMHKHHKLSEFKASLSQSKVQMLSAIRRIRQEQSTLVKSPSDVKKFNELDCVCTF